ncbi:MAG: hypothetical protein MUF58_15770 [Arcicella sp.]|jgi:UDP:flavonoid glycosyltransferase YjiC (YdhE family)|nr:hypothetical protein [Arcicella sp.]
MKTILFIILPYQSHLFATFDFAKKLQKSEAKIVFTGNKHLKELIEAQGFIYEELTYIQENVISKPSIFFAYLIHSLLSKKQKKIRYRAFYQAKQEIENLIQKYQPEQVFIDEYIADYYFLIKKDVNVSLINTRPSTKRVKGIPPLNSSFKPTYSVFSNIICEYLWIKHLWKREINEFVYYLAYGGVDEKVFLYRMAKKNGKNYQLEIDKNHCLNKSIKGITTYNLSPLSFEFSFRKPQKNEEFFFEKHHRNETQYMDMNYTKLINHVKQMQLQGKKIIYLSFGTLSSVHLQDVLFFIERLTAVFSRKKNLELIISGIEYKPKNHYTNVFTYSFIPQVDFLKYVDLMINHGGIGSIKECIQNNVKILAYPLNPKTDQKGCAVRVELLGYGFKGDIKESVSEIECKINRLLGL